MTYKRQKNLHTVQVGLVSSLPVVHILFDLTVQHNQKATSGSHHLLKLLIL